MVVVVVCAEQFEAVQSCEGNGPSCSFPRTQSMDIPQQEVITFKVTMCLFGLMTPVLILRIVQLKDIVRRSILPKLRRLLVSALQPAPAGKLTIFMSCTPFDLGTMALRP